MLEEEMFILVHKESTTGLLNFSYVGFFSCLLWHLSCGLVPTHLRFSLIIHHRQHAAIELNNIGEDYSGKMEKKSWLHVFGSYSSYFSITMIKCHDYRQPKEKSLHGLTVLEKEPWSGQCGSNVIAGDWRRKLRDHIFNCKFEAKRKTW